MSTLENTISMLEVLPETDLIKIQDFIKKLLQTQKADSPFCPKSRKEIYEELEVSRKQVAKGKCRTAKEVFHDLERKYGV